MRDPRSAGFSYVGVLLAIMLLALCAAPAADAVRNAAAAPDVSARQLRLLLCVKSQIEVVMAEPYQLLRAAAAGAATPAPAYSLAADPDPDAGCPARNVYISMVSVDADGVASAAAADTGLLQLGVALPEPTPMSLATMVTR